ncbi:hypothetical protein V7266_03445, partial [Neobacillus drentensis]|uniref:hypothetical protein n=1 Tax=Neobacillus drentensis TaxID=220684 RepID=UPI0030006FE9
MAQYNKLFQKGIKRPIAYNAFLQDKRIKGFNFENCLAPAPSPSMVYRRSVQKVKKQPFGRLVLCLS